MRSPVTWMKRFNTFHRCVVWMCVLVLAIGLAGCSDRPSSGRPAPLSSNSSKRFAKEIVEVDPPALVQSARQALDTYQPQVKILSPRPGQVLDDTQASVSFQVSDFPLFKDEALGLGPHLHVVLDNEKYQPVYDASQRIVFDNLTPGTHTIRAFASRPWHESFKNAGAYTQVSFDVFTNTENSAPDENQPILTYSRPAGSYGAEPIMLDFYLTNAPLHVLARESEKDEIEDWQIRGTVNGQSFTFDTWEPIYLTGFVPGVNWVKLELIDTNGKVIDGPFNSTARLIDYQPGGNDALSKLVRGELSMDAVMQMVDPDYEPAPDVIEPESDEEGTVDERDESEVSLPESNDLGIESSASSASPNVEERDTETEPESKPERRADESTRDELLTLDEDMSDEATSDEEVYEETSGEAIVEDEVPPQTVTRQGDRNTEDEPSAIAPESSSIPELSPVEESDDFSDQVIEPIPKTTDIPTETEIDAPIDSPVEEGVDVMPPDFEDPDPDEELADVAA